mgnify:CR=1 FL=1
MARLETVFSGTTIVLFVATVSYVIFSAVYACIRAVRYDARQQGPGWVDGDGPGAVAPREETKRALETIPVRVVVLQQQQPTAPTRVAGERTGGGAATVQSPPRQQ